MKNNLQQALNRFSFLVEIIPEKLKALSEEEFSFKPSPNKWSKKQIVGHLIDSATNNHQRFVRTQFEDIPEIKYDQNKWNECGFYQSIESQQIISFWTIYNLQILEIVKRIPKENLSKLVSDGEKIWTLEAVFIDYVAHLEHHLKQVVEY